MVADIPALRRRLEALLGIPATSGNTVEMLRNGDEIFPAMRAAIDAAQNSVDLLTYIFRDGAAAEDIAAALAARARAGCRVRVLVDALGSATLDPQLAERMESAGVQLQRFRPPWLRSPLQHNHRTHRKVLVVDGRVGFTGGVGIAHQWLGDARGPDEWRDTQIRLTGPAVAGLTAAFVQNWAETTGDPESPGEDYPEPVGGGDQTVQVVRGTATVGWDDIETAWYALITSAQRRITLQTAYFAPDEAFLELLRGAAATGVQVQVLLPGPHYDKALSRLASERCYTALLESGVEVWRYQPTMLHTKIVTVDDSTAMIGSANFNRRSLDHDEEVACILIGGRAPALLAADFDRDLARARQVLPREWRRRPIQQRAAEQAVRPLSRFL